jgi:hypothetical protein
VRGIKRKKKRKTTTTTTMIGTYIGALLNFKNPNNPTIT